MEIPRILKIFLGFQIICILVIVCSCNSKTNQANDNEAVNTINRLEKIRESGKLIALTDYNSTNYFIYRGTPMGYQFELLQSFADHLGVKLEIQTTC